MPSLETDPLLQSEEGRKMSTHPDKHAQFEHDVLEGEQIIIRELDDVKKGLNPHQKRQVIMIIIMIFLLTAIVGILLVVAIEARNMLSEMNDTMKNMSKQMSEMNDKMGLMDDLKREMITMNGKMDIMPQMKDEMSIMNGKMDSMTQGVLNTFHAVNSADSHARNIVENTYQLCLVAHPFNKSVCHHMYQFDDVIPADP
eukprot:Colp12_sorted_trinity150504_noHs@23253